MGDVNLEIKLNNLSDRVDNLSGGGVTEDELNTGLAKKIDKPTNVTSGKVATSNGSGGVTWETPVTKSDLNKKIDNPTGSVITSVLARSRDKGNNDFNPYWLDIMNVIARRYATQTNGYNVGDLVSYDNGLWECVTPVSNQNFEEDKPTISNKWVRTTLIDYINKHYVSK